MPLVAYPRQNDFTANSYIMGWMRSARGTMTLKEMKRRFRERFNCPLELVEGEEEIRRRGLIRSALVLTGGTLTFRQRRSSQSRVA